MQRWKLVVLLGCLSLGPLALATGPGSYSEERERCRQHDPSRQPFFGDLHVHTRYSLDASTQGTRTTPDQAYRFARGEAIGIQPWTGDRGALRSLQLRRPLDFAMVSDHAELIGDVHMCTTPGLEGYNSWQCLVYRHLPRVAYYLFNYMSSMKHSHLGQCGENGELCREAAKAPWAEMQQAAEAHYDRGPGCAFTTFVGYEWTGVQPDSGGNLHRNVVFRNASVPGLPASYIDGPSAYRLWQSLREQCDPDRDGCDVLAIPHNSNMSAGYMFNGRLDDGGAITRDYASLRRQYEPLAEIVQHKGASECYGGPGASDELCAFEALAVDNIAGYDQPAKPDSGFLRQALADGMRLEQELGVNPYQLGFIGSTDTHLGTPGAAEEDRFLGHGGAGVPARDEIPPGLPDKLAYNPGGLAVLWAAENSRDALFEAMRRREAYATSGPRIVTRFFGGWNYPGNLCESPDRVAAAYAGGVPMGGELGAAEPGASPAFLVAASQDAGTPDAPGMPLQRIQIVKGWLDDKGVRQEKVIDVAGDAGNRATVNTASCEPRGGGFSELCRVWRDDDFDPARPAFYYTRVLENPSCRWSQRMCVAAGVDCARPETIGEGYEGCCAAEHQPVIQERAWTSPIWYRPGRDRPGQARLGLPRGLQLGVEIGL